VNFGHKGRRLQQGLSAHATHHCQQCKWQATRYGEAPGDNYATVIHLSDNTVTLHSKVRRPVREASPTSFWAVLRSYIPTRVPGNITSVMVMGNGYGYNKAS